MTGSQDVKAEWEKVTFFKVEHGCGIHETQKIFHLLDWTSAF